VIYRAEPAGTRLRRARTEGRAPFHEAALRSRSSPTIELLDGPLDASSRAMLQRAGKNSCETYGGGNREPVPTGLIEVTFRFPKSTEIRYVDHPPSPGDLVETRHGRTWLVSEVQAEHHGAYTAICVPPVKPRRTLWDIAAERLGRRSDDTPSRTYRPLCGVP